MVVFAMREIPDHVSVQNLQDPFSDGFFKWVLIFRPIPVIPRLLLTIAW